MLRFVYNKLLFLLLILLFCFKIVYAQDVSTLLNNKPIKFSGRLNTSETLYMTNDSNAFRDPFMWTINGNFNISIYETFNIPFSFVLSKENKKFDQPSYQQFGISPSYKSLTVHVGYRNLNFSRYTLSGITFLGGGIEYAPKNSFFKLKGFYGRFARAQQFIADNMYNPQAIFVMPKYERWGYGTMLTIGKKDHLFDLILFKSSDDELSAVIPDSLSVYPEENFVIGFNSKNKLLKDLYFELNYSLSALSTDVRQSEIHQETYSYANNLGFLFTPRSSSQFNSVIDASINFTPGKVNVGFKYLRIDPEYKSLGTSFINNDVQEFTGNIATTLNKNKMSIAGNIGVQNNNLNKKQLVTNKRFISALNYTWLINKNLNLVASLSNYNTNAMPVQIYLVDSIKYSQVTSNASLNLMENFGDSIIQHGISGMFCYQNGNTLNQTGESISDVTNTFINTYITYRLNYVKTGLCFLTTINYSNYISDIIDTKSFGPSIGVTKSLLKQKINTGINMTFMNSFGCDSNNTQILNMRLFARYKINKYNSLNISINGLNRTMNKISSFHAQVNFSYNLIF